MTRASFIGLLAAVPRTAADVCPTDALAISAYGLEGHPSLLPSELNFSDVTQQAFFSGGPSSCFPSYANYRAYQAAVPYPYGADPAMNCVLGASCKPTKVNSIQATSCSELLEIRNTLAEGGFTAFCRHELTDWSMQPAETNGCKLDGSCTTHSSPLVQRQLASIGHRRARSTGNSLKGAGITIEALASSPYARCQESALRVGEAFGLSNVSVDSKALMYAGDPVGYAQEWNITSASPSNQQKDVNRFLGANARIWLGDAWVQHNPTGNRYVSTHGFTQKVAIGHLFDEGDCAWGKPAASTYSSVSLDISSLGSTTTWPSAFPANTSRFDMLTVLSPEATEKMAQCYSLKQDLAAKTSVSSVVEADANQDLKVSQQEFEAHFPVALWGFALKVQAFLYYRAPSTTELGIGQFAYFNGGWREYETSDGGWAYPWRKATFDTIAPTATRMKQLYAPLDMVLERSLSPAEADALLVCTPASCIVNSFAQCQASGLLSVPTIHTTDEDPYRAADASEPLAFPSILTIPSLENPLVRIAQCLAHNEVFELNDVLSRMGCPSSTLCAAASESKRHTGKTVRIIGLEEAKLPNLYARAREFEAATGATVQITQANVKEWPGMVTEDVGSIASGGLGPQLFDAYVVKGNWVAEQAYIGALAQLDELIAQGNAWSDLDWTDIVKVARDAICTYNSSVYALPLDADYIVTAVREDLLGSADLPETWEDLASFAEAQHGRDLNGDGVADYGVCMAKGPESTHFSVFAPLWTIAAPYLQRNGTRGGSFFDVNTLAPFFEKPEFTAALQIFQQLNMAAKAGDVSAAAAKGYFQAGECAVWLSLPGFVFGVQDTTGITAPAGASMARIKSPGVECASISECPHAELSSQTGKLINRAPFLATSGTALAISSKATTETQQLAFELFTYMTATAQSSADVVLRNSFSDPFRKSHLGADAQTRLLAQGWSLKAATEYLQTTDWALNHPNAALDLRVPGIDRYMSTALQSIAPYVHSSTGTAQEAAAAASLKWRSIPSGIFEGSSDMAATAEMIDIYRAQLGLPVIVIRSDDGNTTIIVAAVLGSILGVVLLVLVGLAIRQYREVLAERRRRRLKIVLDLLTSIAHGCSSMANITFMSWALRASTGKQTLPADEDRPEKKASEVPAWRRKELKEAFDLLDADHSGELSIDELIAMAPAEGGGVDQFKKILIDLDTDKSGKVSFEEFVSMLTGSLSEHKTPNQLSITFDHFDTRGAGMLSENDLKLIAEDFGEHLADELIGKMVNSADIDGDGKVSRSDLITYITGKKESAIQAKPLNISVETVSTTRVPEVTAV